MKFSYEEVFEAYVKLKTYIYYDPSNLFMRKQLAIFETNLYDSKDFLEILFEEIDVQEKYLKDENIAGLEVFEVKLRVFTEALNTYHKDAFYFDRLLSRIEFKFLPKKIDDGSYDNSIISNKRTAEEYNIVRSSVFIDCPLELHLLSVIWILREGVNLDRQLVDYSFGNRLILNRSKNGIVQGSGLFKPYPKQYQIWRDKAVKVARDCLKDNQNVLILNLDIKDFFYSVRINKDDISGPISEPSRSVSKFERNLYVLFSRIHECFTGTLAKKYEAPYPFLSEIADERGNIIKFILPIGLLSSFVLANHYMVDFDQRIIKNSKPSYYGRYVDDILMVISNPVLPNEQRTDSLTELNFDFDNYSRAISESAYHDEKEVFTESDYNSLSNLEKFVLNNFYPIISLIDKPAFLHSSGLTRSKTERLFKLVGYQRLYCQSDKTLLYYFDKDESELVIDKLKRDLEEKSSEFKNYSDAEGDEDFEESAYHLLYDGTEGKIRTLKDYKEDKFGLSVYLSKRIFNALRRADKIGNDEADKIVKFFRGCNTLNLYTLWERVFVFLLVNNKHDAYVRFYLYCSEAISRMKIVNSPNDVDQEKYLGDVFDYLHIANELALSLHPKFLSEIASAKRLYDFSLNKLKRDHPFYEGRYNALDDESGFINRFRRSNLLRHHYTTQPLFSYTRTSKKDYTNYTHLRIKF